MLTPPKPAVFPVGKPLGHGSEEHEGEPNAIPSQLQMIINSRTEIFPTRP